MKEHPEFSEDRKVRDQEAESPMEEKKAAGRGLHIAHPSCIPEAMSGHPFHNGAGNSLVMVFIKANSHG